MTPTPLYLTGERLMWRHSFRNSAPWYRPVVFVRLAGATRAVVKSAGGDEYTVPLKNLLRVSEVMP